MSYYYTSPDNHWIPQTNLSVGRQIRAFSISLHLSPNHCQTCTFHVILVHMYKIFVSVGLWERYFYGTGSHWRCTAARDAVTTGARTFGEHGATHDRRLAYKASFWRRECNGQACHVDYAVAPDAARFVVI